MKQGIHPEYKQAKIVCSCGNEIETRSTQEEIHVEICAVCHPFYTGRQKLVDTAGRVERFKRKYGDVSSGDDEEAEDEDREVEAASEEGEEARAAEASGDEAAESAGKPTSARDDGSGDDAADDEAEDPEKAGAAEA